METTGLFNPNNPDIKFSQLCSITKDRIESFLPGLWEDLFRAVQSSGSQVVANEISQANHSEQINSASTLSGDQKNPYSLEEIARNVSPVNELPQYSSVSIENEPSISQGSSLNAPALAKVYTNITKLCKIILG
jgi:hypothetical protein